MIRVGLILRDQRFRKAISDEIQEEDGVTLTCVHPDLESMQKGIKDVSEAQADVVVLEYLSSEKETLRAMRSLLDKFPDTEIIILGDSSKKEMVLNSLKIGANSFMEYNSPVEEIIKGVFTVSRGGSILSPDAARELVEVISSAKVKKKFKNLTPRQMDIIKGIADGLSYKLIADEYNISLDTVRSHIKRIYKILNVHSKIEVVNLYRNLKDS